MTRQFPVPPPGKLTLLSLLGIGLLVPVAVTVGILVKGDPPPPQASAVAAAAIIVVLGLAFATLRRRSIAIEGDYLVVRGGIRTLRVPIATLDLDGARVLSLEEYGEDRPFWRLSGVRLPGYRAGHFYTRGRTRLFCLLTDTTRVLRLKESSDRLVLLSLERPAALLDALARWDANTG